VLKGKTPKNLMTEVNKLLGQDAVIMGSDPRLSVQYIPTGVIPIDVLLKGGLPRGRWTEFYGDFSTLKSYIAYRALASTQHSGVGGLVDTEHAYDPGWFQSLGGKPSDLVIQRPNTGEDAVAAIEFLVRQGIDLIVWDSIAATLPKDEAAKDPRNTSQPARLAALMSAALRRLNAANKRTAVLALNQTRTNVGIVFGPSESIPGGRALPFYASYRVSLRKAGKITRDVRTWDGDKYITVKERIGIKVRAQLEKSKLNAPDREAWMVYMLKDGTLDDIGFLMAQGLEHGYLERNKKGSWRWTDDSDSEWMTGEELRSAPQADWDWLKDELITN
jgi:recombination protein RecA